MTISADALCNHCLLPIGARAMRRTVNGESRAFCCYGCCIAYQVNTGNSKEWEAAWRLIRLGVGAFLSMNIMLFSILLYAGAVGVAALRVAAGKHFPTDVVAGAALGSAVGWLVPTIHPAQR